MNKTLSILLIIIMPVCGLSIDMYAPALPQLSVYYHCSVSQMQFSIAILVAGFGIGQIFVGPLSDYVGRKPILIVSLLIFCLTSLTITIVPNLFIFNMMRFIQGLAISGQVLCVRSIIADKFTGYELSVISVYTTTAWTMSPVLGPGIGGILITFFSWKAVFYVLSVYSLLLLLVVCIIYAETNLNRNRFSLKLLQKNANIIIKNKEFMKNVISLGIGFSMLNCFNLLAPYYLQNKLHYTPLAYGHLSTVIGVCCILGSMSNRFIIRQLPRQRIITLGINLLFIITILSVINILIFPQYLLNLFIPTALVTFIIGLLYPNFSANCTSMFSEIAGTAAALRGTISIVLSSCILAIISHFHMSSILLLLIIYFFLAVALSIFNNTGISRPCKMPAKTDGDL